MSTLLEVSAGPFAGKSLKGNLVPNLHDITTIATVDAIQATQVFLDTFKPTEGWSLQVTGEIIDLNMVPLANSAGVAAHCPTALFKAALLKDGALVNTASTLWVLSGPTEWEKGETNARLRLYQAMGLPIRQDMGIIEPMTTKSRPTLTAVPSPYKERDDGPTKSEHEVIVEKPSEPAAPADEPTTPVAIEAPAEAVAAVETAASEPTPPDAAPVLSNPAPVTSTDGPNKALLENIRRVCNMRGQAMPDLKTKAEAEAFLKQLLKKGG